ncbi:MAG: ABC transporter permease [Bacillota bacterium]|jgi:peptide/nickel transport system permease protein
MLGSIAENPRKKAGQARQSRIRAFWSAYSSKKSAVVGLALIAICVLVAVAAPLIAPEGPNRFYDGILQPPGQGHPFGTDPLGRDVFAGVIWGTRISLLFALGVAALSLLVGVVLGALSGYWGGWVDELLSRGFEVFLMLPRFFLIILIVALFGQNIVFTAIIVGLTSWVTNARLTRAQVMTVKERVFVQASLASGVSRTKVLFRHVLPNGLYPVIANSTLEMAGAIITEAALSFLGLGDPNHLSWGQILYSAQMHIHSWWLAVFPGLAIFMLTFALNLVGDGISYAFNPRIRERR